MKKQELVNSIRELVLSHYFGVMSTLGEEYPHGSLVRYSLDHLGQPVFLFSRIAEHSRNLQRSDKASLFVLEQKSEDGKPANIQECARVSLQGKIEPIDNDHPDFDECLETYLAYFPESKSWFETLDFDLFRLAIEQCQYVGGFAAAHSLSGNDYRQVNPLGLDERRQIIGHMNQDHGDAIVHYCKQRAIELNEHSPEIVYLNGEGFQVKVGAAIERIRFEQPVHDRVSARDAFVEMARRQP